MKKIITVGCLTGTLYIYLLTIHFGDAVMQFLVAGVIPGTQYILPAADVLNGISFFVIAGIFAVFEHYGFLRSQLHDQH